MSETDPEPESAEEDYIVYRLVPRVSANPFMAIFNPRVRLGMCSRCPSPVWMSDDEMPDYLVPLCVECGLADEQIHDIVARMLGIQPEPEAEGGAEDAALHRHLEGRRRRDPVRRGVDGA